VKCVIKHFSDALLQVIHTTLNFETMVFSEEDNILNKSLHLSKGYNASRLFAEFPTKGRAKRSINWLLQNLQKLRESNKGKVKGTVSR